MTDSLYPTVASPYPARLTGRLDSPSRGLWLVKWFLAIPHVVVLFFLNIAVFVTTVIGFFAILFTGRYPRSLFDFAVGVLRWGWRVSFYAFSPLGTDTYPPFTLKRTDYPADFDVDYPESLSRGLVLVKWWLLAIPHYLIVGAVAGTSMFLWRGDNGEHHEMVNGHLTTLSSGSSGGGRCSRSSSSLRRLRFCSVEPRFDRSSSSSSVSTAGASGCLRTHTYLPTRIRHSASTRARTNP
jgi:hypothetical protein